MPRTLLLASVLTLALSGCSDDGTPVADPTATSTPSPVASITASPTESPTPGPTPSATQSPTAAPTRGPAKDGDVDGDGRISVAAPVTADDPSVVEVLGSYDVDRDGRAEIFLRTVQGASTAFATPYRFDGKGLYELTIDEEPARLGYGGSVTHGDGFSCGSGGRIVQRSATARDDGSTYDVTAVTYRLTRDALVETRRQTSVATQDSDELAAAYQLACGGVSDD
jgi:hypothetical protein